MTEWVLQAHDLCKSFTDAKLQVEVLHGVNLQVAKGERIAIVGSSGSGKSTLLHLLGGLDEPSSGSVDIAGQNIHAMKPAKRGQWRNQTLGFIYQFHHLLSEFTALENVCMPLLIRGLTASEAERKAEDMLTRVGLKQRLQHKPGELSGGERQRAAVARALVTQPQCVLADEPTGNLDQKNALQVYDTMLELNAQVNTSLVVVTHDETLAARMDKVLHLNAGVLE